MTIQDINKKIKEGSFFFIKTSFRSPNEIRVEVTDEFRNIVQEANYYDAIDLPKAQLHMLSIAGQLTNKGNVVFINPFTN